jgi:predicted lipoprotein with Yx(FWY)xxD motif
MLGRVLLCAAAVGLLAAACGDSDDDGSTDTTEAGATTTAAPGTTAAPDTTAGEATTTAAPDTTAGGAGATTTAAGSAAAGSVALELTSGDLGEYLVDGDGNTLYLFMPDEGGGESTCYDDCAANWPPFEGEASAGEGVDTALVSTTARTDGTTQVTYNGWPLYYFGGDAAPGDTNGQGVLDIWYVVGADGEGIS